MTQKQTQTQSRKQGQKTVRLTVSQPPGPAKRQKQVRDAERSTLGRKPTAQQAVAHRVVSVDGRIALWQQLQQAARLMQAVMQGRSAPTVLDELPPTQRAGVQALGYLALRRLGVARWLREQLVPRTPPPAVDALLCTALALAWKSALELTIESTSTAAAASADSGVAQAETADSDSREQATRAATSATHRAQAEAALYNDFTLVHQAVEAARRHPRMRHQAGLVNACLRTFVREREAWQARCHQAAPQGRAELLNLPAWWWQCLQLDYPGLVDPASVYPASHAANNMVNTAEGASTAASDAASQEGSFTASAGHERASAVTPPQSQAMSMAAAIALAGQHPPPMHLRVNARCMSPAQYLQEHLLPAGLAGQLHGDYGIMLRKPCPVQQLPGFAQGWVSVQDAAAQLAAPLLLHALQQQAMSQPVTQPVKQARVQTDAQSGAPLGTHWRLLDACAAPGGKTAHLLELEEHDVTALDIDAARCARIRENLQRLGLHAQVQVADAGQPAAWWNGQLFDGILLDAPCSASGIVRRHPDIAWLRREADIAQLVRTQQQLLHALWPLLRPGGVLLYATCSVFRAEGQDQVDAFLARHNDAASLPAPGHLLPNSGLVAAGLGHNGLQAVSEKALLHGAQAAQSAVQAAGAANKPQWLDHDGFYYALFVKTV